MRFTIREGADPVGQADSALLSAMGMPGGGVAKVGRTHVLVRPGRVTEPTALLVGPRTATNAGVDFGSAVNVTRANLGQARLVRLDADDLSLGSRHLARALQGGPVTVGDVISVDPSYGDHPAEPFEATVLSVQPDDAGLVGNATVVAPRTGGPEIVGHPEGTVAGDSPTTAEALLAGLDTEVEVMTGWLSLLTGAGNLPAAWGLPTVAGVLLEGPSGCGKSELVAEAAARTGASVSEVALDLVFKPEKLIDVLDRAIKEAPAPSVIFVDRLDAVAGDEGMFRTQVAAVMRWFLDAVADRPRVACVLGVSSVDGLDDNVAASPLLPRTLSIPPPDLERRTLLFEAALRRVPTDEVDFAALANRSAGFSGADVIAAVVHASAMAAGSDTKVSTESLLEALAGTPPSLGSVPTGEMPTYGFEKVANLDVVKERLTESVIWPLTDPERFTRMGIVPPRGILLFGPPGTGKTYVTRALAHESGAAFFAVKGAELLDKFVGESERGVREVFAQARAAAPAILFFDELDALAPVRGRSTNSVTDSVVAALLTELDGVTDRGDVTVIGATNRADLIDPALLRSGRFETHIELGLPEVSARRALLAITDVPFAGDVDLDAIAEATEGLSFADLTGMLREAALIALRADATALSVDAVTLEAALATFRGRVSADRTR